MQACTPGNGSAGQLTYGSGLIGVREQAPLRRGWEVSGEGNFVGDDLRVSSMQSAVRQRHDNQWVWCWRP